MPPTTPSSLTSLRTLTTTSNLHPSKPPATFTTRMLPYPHGPSQHYKQSNSGLYGASTIQFGNRVSSKNEIKTRRSWRPNIHHKRLWSDALQKFLAVKVQARVLRTIDKVGGVDEYLLGGGEGRVRELGVEGWRLRWEVGRSERVRERVGAERVRLGVPVEGYVGGGVRDVVERVSGEVVGKIEEGDGKAASEDKNATLSAGTERVRKSKKRSRGKKVGKAKLTQSDQPKANDVAQQLVGIKTKGDGLASEKEQASVDENIAKTVQANDSRSIFRRMRGWLRR